MADQLQFMTRIQEEEVLGMLSVPRSADCLVWCCDGFRMQQEVHPKSLFQTAG